ncbi:hypothetical protein BKA67DRAFT_642468 [Truncatella angustata]|uniref:Uncharacterized protein n=1 Tax=Truncatella angustata TaxID=152316 RepID=A0A9P8UQ58_9PEZI|nr:uncharacterized protein BKA67DRAFT_642468 [Truncatella angustata]KAH6656308.1 hypothetical protein BKA67DRAFT_642468 [Truncatella angustata]
MYPSKRHNGRMVQPELWIGLSGRPSTRMGPHSNMPNHTLFKWPARGFARYNTIRYTCRDSTGAYNTRECLEVTYPSSYRTGDPVDRKYDPWLRVFYSLSPCSKYIRSPTPSVSKNAGKPFTLQWLTWRQARVGRRAKRFCHLVTSKRLFQILYKHEAHKCVFVRREAKAPCSPPRFSYSVSPSAAAATYDAALTHVPFHDSFALPAYRYTQSEVPVRLGVSH